MKSCCKESGVNEKDQQELQTISETDQSNWLSRLKSKWQVGSIVQVVLILCTFAIGGSLCAFLGRTIKNAIGGLPGGFAGVLISILLATILWPLCVLLVSIPLGQFGFFRKYLSKLGRRMFRRKAG